MRKALLIGACVLAFAAPVRAQMAVIDVKSIAQLTSQLGVLRQQYQQLTNVYGSVAHLTNGATMAPGLLGGAVQNPLGSLGLGSLGGIMQGNVGGGFPCSNYSQSYMGQQQVYEPQGDDWTAQQMRQRFTSLTNMQGLATCQMQATQQRMEYLPQLQEELSAAQDVQQVNAIQARIGMEQAYVQTQQQQAQQLLALAQIQAQVEDQRTLQNQRRDYEALKDKTANELTGGEGGAGGGWQSQPGLVSTAIPMFRSAAQ